MDNYLVANQIRPKFVKGKDNGQKFFFSGGIIQLGIIQGSASIVHHLEYSFSFLP